MRGWLTDFATDAMVLGGTHQAKTLAFKITEELDQRLKDFIAAEKKRGRKITQKEFVIGLIEQALAEYEAQNQPAEMTEA